MNKKLILLFAIPFLWACKRDNRIIASPPYLKYVIKLALKSVPLQGDIHLKLHLENSEYQPDHKLLVDTTIEGVRMMRYDIFPYTPKAFFEEDTKAWIGRLERIDFTVLDKEQVLLKNAISVCATPTPIGSSGWYCYDTHEPKVANKRHLEKIVDNTYYDNTVYFDLEK